MATTTFSTSSTMRRFSWLKIALGILVVSAAIGLIFPAVESTRDGLRKPHCANNLTNLSLALHQYHTDLGCYPPPFIADAKGKPLHSWRVLLLPYLQQKALHSRYRFDEPWDGPNNRKLHDIELQVFQCPGQKKKQRPFTETNYAVVVGPQTIWPGANAYVRDADVMNGLSNTLLLVEVADSGIHWMEPRDLDIDQMPLAINPPHVEGNSGPCISSHHPGGANAAFADGSVRFLPNNLSPETLRSILNAFGKRQPPLPPYLERPETSAPQIRDKIAGEKS
jgi:prepilin-type processing-associated H-X9-DG protein